jgi:hypothetical protein
MELSKLVAEQEQQVEEKFEQLEVKQTQFDEINESYENNIRSVLSL